MTTSTHNKEIKIEGGCMNGEVGMNPVAIGENNEKSI